MQSGLESLNFYKGMKDQTGIARQLGTLGSIYCHQSELSLSEQHHRQSLEICQRLGFKLWEINQLGGLGKVYLKLEDYPKAIGYFESASKIAEETGNQHVLTNQLNDLSAVIIKQSMATQSSHSANQAIQLAERAIQITEKSGDRVQRANACANLAQACVLVKDLSRAHEAALQAGNLFTEFVGPTHEKVLYLMGMAENLKQKIIADYKQGLDWRRAFNCPNCRDRFPWVLQFDTAFEAGLDFLQTKCPKCGVEFIIDRSSDKCDNRDQSIPIH